MIGRPHIGVKLLCAGPGDHDFSRDMLKTGKAPLTWSRRPGNRPTAGQRTPGDRPQQVTEPIAVITRAVRSVVAHGGSVG